MMPEHFTLANYCVTNSALSRLSRWRLTGGDVIRVMHCRQWSCCYWYGTVVAVAWLLATVDIVHSVSPLISFQCCTSQTCLLLMPAGWYTTPRVRHNSDHISLTTIVQKRRLTLFGHLVTMDESTDARRILTAVPQSEWRRPVGRPLHLLDGHSEERPSSARPYLGGCCRTGSE